MWCSRSRRCTTRDAAARSPTRCRWAAGSSRSRAVDSAHRRRSTFPAPFAPGSASSTTCRSCRGTSSRRRSAPARSRAPGGCRRRRRDIAGLGPFVLARVCARAAAGLRRATRATSAKAPTATPLPYLDRVDRRDRARPERGAAAARGGPDRHDDDRGRAEDYAPLKRAADAGTRQAARSRRRLRRRQPLVQPEAGRLRAAIRARRGCSATSCARRSRWPSIGKLFADTVFLGAGVPVYGPDTPANKKWYWPARRRPPHDPARPGSCWRRSGSPIATATGCSKTPQPAGPVHAAHAEGTAERSNAARGHPRRAEEDRRRRWTSSTLDGRR